jgi:hypothetical protein
MYRPRALFTLAALAAAPVAQAQPVDPYRTPAPARPAPATPTAPAAPAPAPTAGSAPQDPYAAAPLPSGQDPVLAERVAEALVNRAGDLLDAKVYLDAKQLAVEALVASPKGSSAPRARQIIHAVNVQLGIPEDAPRPEPEAAKPTEDVDTTPIQDPTQGAPPLAPPPEGAWPTLRIASSVHGGLYGGVVGAAIGSTFSSSAAKGAVPTGLVLGAVGALALPRLVDKLGWTEGEVRTVGAATVWGGAIGGLAADLGSLNATTGRQVLISAAIGASVAGVGGYALSRSTKLTRGDVALIDTLAGIGAVGGLTAGMLMQPARTEAYSLNSIVGIAGGALIGYIAAPETNTTPRRMLRVAGMSALGGALPFLLYAAIRSPTTTADERLTGLLATSGLIGGAALGFRLTEGMDEGLDTLDGKPRKAVDDAPIALIGRSSAGAWGVGGLGLAPLSPVLAPEHGMTVQVVGAAF